MIIGLCGFSRVGKNVAADGMTGYEQVAFADALKRKCSEIAEQLTGCHYDFTDTDTKIKHRKALVCLGEMLRDLHQDFWIEELFKNLAFWRKDVKIVVSDVRYRNECEAIKNLGGKIIYIIRPGYGPANDVERDSILEILDSGIIDHTIVNDGSIEELQQKVKDLL